MERLLEFAQENSQKLSLMHQSVILAKLRGLVVEQGDSLSATVRMAAQNHFHRTARNLLNNTHNIDATSLASTINLLAKKDAGMPFQSFKPDRQKCQQIENQILAQWELYINQDISVVASSLMRLDYTPKAMLDSINRMK